MELRWPSWSAADAVAALSQLNPSAFPNRRWPNWPGSARATRRTLGVWGAVVGALAAWSLFAPAAWLASRWSRATDQRLLLADARGTVWNGSAQPVLTGGPGSRDAAALPGRLHWQISAGCVTAWSCA